jgi:hypothetical protein
VPWQRTPFLSWQKPQLLKPCKKWFKVSFLSRSCTCIPAVSSSCPLALISNYYIFTLHSVSSIEHYVFGQYQSKPGCSLYLMIWFVFLSEYIYWRTYSVARSKEVFCLSHKISWNHSNDQPNSLNTIYIFKSYGITNFIIFRTF